MKIVIAYPPLESPKGIPFLGQNRQFQWSKVPWTAYPMVPAYAATLLKKAGYPIAWLDGIAGGQTYQEWFNDLRKEKADLMLIETKTPVVKLHWKIIDKLKTNNSKLKIVLVGDHVTALPEESFKNSRVDYILAGGDYDFLLLNLVNHLTRGEKLEPGIWYRKNSKIKTKISNPQLKYQNYKSTGRFRLNHNLDGLPFIDRELTCWRLYAYKNSNYSRTPGTYTMFGRDCWWGKCTFCSWTTLYPGRAYRVMSPKRAIDEIGYILDHWPVREIMDDSGTFPVGDWLREFCEGMIRRGYNKKIKIDCNMRFNASLTQQDYDRMAKAGFRFILYGLESANQKTLDRVNKNLQVAQISRGVRMAKEAGLWPHVTVMVGYPWETKKEVLKTLSLAQQLFKNGWVDTLQATIVIPYPGTPLFAQCQKNNWLKTTDWSRYDMKEPVMKTPITDEEIMALIRNIYSSFLTPEFIWRKLKEGLTDWDRFKYYTWLGVKYFSKRKDFNV
ncbi:MAG TPA: radical SAM protein [Candidatus Bathyarchaeia archaeon]|nr:radical SAM protein [Candidatus Bathyarchaeia archaeon]